MLATAAARAVSGRGTPAAFRIAVAAGYSRAAVPIAQLPQLARFASSLNLQTQTPRSAHAHRSLIAITFQPYARSFSSNSNRPFPSESDGKPVPDEPSPFATSSHQSDAQSDGFKSKLRQNAENQSADQNPESGSPPTGPLPDLRHGIPSTLSSQQSPPEQNAEANEKDQNPLELYLTQESEGGSRGRRDEESSRESYVSSIERRRNAIATYFYMAAAVASVFGAVYLGRNWSNETEANSHPDAPNGYAPMAIYNRSLERLGMLFEPYTEPAFQKLLPDPPVDPNLRAPYTLVISLEDLLVCSKWDRSNGYTVAKRPGVDYFIKYLTQYYELVIFTTVQQMNADPVIRKLDPFQFCMPLTREATRYMDGEHVKDLAYLNRDLSKTIIIDTVPAHVKLQPENAIILPKWKGDPKDPHKTDLVALIPFLEYIHNMSIGDVRKVLKSYEGTHIPTEFHRRENKAREEFGKRLAEEKGKRAKFGGSSGLSSLSSVFGFKPAQQMMIAPGEEAPVDTEGKMYTDLMRERGQRAYQEMDKQIREHGEAWLKEKEEQEKKMQDEAAKSMTGWLPFFGAGGSGGDTKQQSDSNS